MLTVILAGIDAFSSERFGLLYLFVLFMDWYILEEVDWKTLFKKGN